MSPEITALIAAATTALGAMAGWFGHARHVSNGNSTASHELDRTRHEEILRGLQSVVSGLAASVNAMNNVAEGVQQMTAEFRAEMKMPRSRRKQ